MSIIKSFGKNPSTKVSINSNRTWTIPSGVNKLTLSGILNREGITAAGIPSSAINEDGVAYTWGTNLGNGTNNTSSSPVALLGSNRYSSLAYRTALSEDGSIWMWGSGSLGSLGDGTTVDKSSPVQAIGGLRFKKLTMSGGLTFDNDIYTWGQNTVGQLGDGTTVDRSSPVLVVGGLKFVDVGYGMGLTESGDCYTWGANNYGQLGDGTIISKSSPVPVLGGLKFSSIMSGNGQSKYGITSDGDVYGWGRNTSGQLGNGAALDRSSPVLVVGGLKFEKLCYATFQTMGAISVDGTAYMWGANQYGQLGDNTSSVGKSSPVAVTGGLKFRHLSSNQTTLGIATNGSLYSWGHSGPSGYLGDGTINISRSSPVLVIGGLRWGNITKIVKNKMSLDVIPGSTAVIQFKDGVLSFNGVIVSINSNELLIEY